MGIDFNIGSLENAMEVGGPMGRSRTKEMENGSGSVVDGQEAGNPHVDQLPHSGGYMSQAIGRELSEKDRRAKR